MTLTGKCKEDFEKWFNRIQRYNIDWFNRLALEYQYGVYVDFFDENDIIVEAQKSLVGYRYFATQTLKHYQAKMSYTRQEARESAITKANEIYNLKQ